MADEKTKALAKLQAAILADDVIDMGFAMDVEAAINGRQTYDICDMIFNAVSCSSTDYALELVSTALPGAEVDRITQSKSLGVWEAVIGLNEKQYKGANSVLSCALVLAVISAWTGESDGGRSRRPVVTTPPI